MTMCWSVIFLIVTVAPCFISGQDVWPTNIDKMMFYSPAIIGQDPHVNKIDIYTSFFANIHRRDMNIITKLGVNHLVVGENWAADGSSVHQGFLDLLIEFNLNLTITYAIPMHDDEKTDSNAPNKNTLRDKAKEAFVLLLKEFTEEKYSRIVKGFFIPMPDVQKMSLKDLQDYFFLINELKGMTTQNYRIISGFPIDPREGKIPDYEYQTVNTDLWAIEIYGADTSKNIDAYTEFCEKKGINIKNIYAVVKIDSYDSLTRSPSEIDQAHNMSETLSKLKVTDSMLEGVVIHEFSDEWWRSDLSSVGFAVEGCPNGNPYAHTPCGIVTYIPDILALEYTGLFQIQDRPLSFCVIAKQVAQTLQSQWTGNVTINAGAEFCEGLPAIVPFYVYPILAGLSLIVFILLLVLPPPTPPPIKDPTYQEHENL